MEEQEGKPELLVFAWELKGLEDARFFLSNNWRVFRNLKYQTESLKGISKSADQRRFLKDWRIGYINTSQIELPGENLNGRYQRGDVVMYKEHREGVVMIAYPPYRHRLQSDLDRGKGVAILRHPRLDPVDKSHITDICRVC